MRRGAEREKERGEQERREWGKIKSQVSEGRETETGRRQINRQWEKVTEIPEEAERWRKADRPREKEKDPEGKMRTDKKKTDGRTKTGRSMSELEELRSGEVKICRAQGVIQSQRWICKSWAKVSG